MKPILRTHAKKHEGSKGYIAVRGNGMLRNNALLAVMLNQPVRRWYPWHNWRQIIVKKPTLLPTHFAGWGNKKSYRRAQQAASQNRRPVLSIEDGFLRSIDTGINSRYGCSIVVDECGIYFNSKKTSTLEKHIIKRQSHWTSTQEDRAKLLINKLISYQLSKYNAVMDSPTLDAKVLVAKGLATRASRSKTSLTSANLKNVLLVDQVAGDASIIGAGANQQQFEEMIVTACNNHPNAHIWIKAHPASQSGYLNNSELLRRLPTTIRERLLILNQPVNVIALLKQVDVVYTVSSHMGFEALMLDKKVYCFGVPWYAGWGMTEDKYAPKSLLNQVHQRRNKIQYAFNNAKNFSKHSKEPSTKPLTTNVYRLFYAAYIDYSRYADPASKRACHIEDVIEWLDTNRNWYCKLPAKITIYEFSRWKIGFVNHFLQIATLHSNSQINVKSKPKIGKFKRHLKIAPNLSHNYLVWGLGGRLKVRERLNFASNKTRRFKFNQPIRFVLDNVLSNDCNQLSQPQPEIWCMEDGFIRSNGLGATLLAPLSVVMDSRGIYYDATHASDLEQMLIQCNPLSASELSRVNALHKKLLTQRVSKYHVGNEKSINIPDDVLRSSEKDIILIVGQVEDDLSVKYCGSSIKTNAALINRVRQDNPNAYLIYKPHPDVEAGLRSGKVDKATLKQVNYVARNIAITDCLDAVDNVHTISSLTGFEALLRGLNVTCYGLPFYAGWGLTENVGEVDNHRKQHRQHYHNTVHSGGLQLTQQIKNQNVIDKFTKRHASEIATDIAGNNNSGNTVELSLEQLIHCALIKYPMYRLPDGYGLAQVEQVIDYLYPNTMHRDGQVQTHTSKSGSNQSNNHQTNNINSNNINSNNIKGMNDQSKRQTAQSKKPTPQILRYVKTKFMQFRHKLLTYNKSK